MPGGRPKLSQRKRCNLYSHNSMRKESIRKKRQNTCNIDNSSHDSNHITISPQHSTDINMQNITSLANPPQVEDDHPITHDCIDTDNDIFDDDDHEDAIGMSNEFENSTYPLSLQNERFLALRQKFLHYLGKVNYLLCDTCNERVFVNFHPRVNICYRCRRPNQQLKYTSANNMDPGPVPEVLQCLTTVEQLLIAQIAPHMCIFRLPRGGQYGFKGHALNLPQDVRSFVLNLPRQVHDLDIIVLRKSNREPHLPPSIFTVRRQKVLLALQWLKHNNPYYSNVNIVHENIASLPENSLANLGSHQYIEESPHTDDVISSQSNASIQDSTENRYSSSLPATFVPTQLPIPDERTAIQAALNQEQVVDWPSIGTAAVNEFNEVGYLARAFPCLFPTGKGDLRAPRRERVTHSEYFKHMLSYHDGMFQSDPRFVFLAFNSMLRWQSLQVGRVFVRNNPQQATLTVQDVQTMLSHEQRSLANRILRFGHQIRGTPQYWFNQRSNLTSMVSQLGKATIFFTFSAADLQWPDLSSFLDTSNRSTADAITHSPLTVDSYVVQRFEIFFKHFLTLYLNIEDYWYRFEWQHRGSLHIHGLAWLNDKPNTAVCEESEVRQFSDSIVSAWNPSFGAADYDINFYHPTDRHPSSIPHNEIDNPEQDLKNLVNFCQRHTRCTPAYCLRRQPDGLEQCRFGFPMPVQPVTTVHFSVNESGKRVKLQVNPARNDPLLNKYNPHCLSVWRANMDISVLFDLTDIANYIAKYTSKAEKASTSYTEIFSNIASNQLPNDAPLQKAASSLLLKTVGNLDVSAQQAVHIISGIPLHKCSREFVLCVADGQTIEDQINADEPSAIRKYMRRPAEYDQFSLAHMLQNFTFRNTESGIVCKHRRKTAILRVVPKLPSDVHSPLYVNYCMQFLTLHKPFRSWLDLTQGFNDVVSAYQHFVTSHSISTTCISQHDDVDNAVESAAAEQAANPMTTHSPEFEVEPWMSIVNNEIPGNCMSTLQNGVNDDYDWVSHSHAFQHLIRPAQTFITDAKQLDTRGYHQRNLANPKHLNLEQRAVYDFVCGHDNEEPLNVMVLGTAGTGKSFLINCTKQHFGTSCILLAPTGVAALNVGGETVHSFFKFVKANQMTALQGEAPLLLQQKCSCVKYIIIDELSMLGCYMLNAVDKRLRQAFPQKNHLFFGGCNMILFGDIGQLPPVGDHKMFVSTSINEHAAHGHAAYRQFTRVFFLKQSVRQAQDQNFSDVLLRIRDGKATEADYNMLSMRFTGIADDSEFADATRLFAKRQCVDKYNSLRLQKLGKPVALLESGHNNTEARKASSNNACGLERFCSLAIGAKVMLRTNLWVEKGLVNGSIGTVNNIIFKDQGPPSLPSVVICNFPDYTGPSFLSDEDHSVPIIPIQRHWSVDNNVNILRRTGIPLSLAWAITIHKSQGLTLPKAVVDIGKQEMTAGISFVALSRVRCIDDLLLAPFAFSRIQSICKSTQITERLHEEQLLQSFLT